MGGCFMNRTTLVSNSSSYQPKTVIDKYNVKIISLSIIFGKKPYTGYLGAVIGTQVGERTDSIAWYVK